MASLNHRGTKGRHQISGGQVKDEASRGNGRQGSPFTFWGWRDPPETATAVVGTRPVAPAAVGEGRAGRRLVEAGKLRRWNITIMPFVDETLLFLFTSNN